MNREQYGYLMVEVRCIDLSLLSLARGLARGTTRAHISTAKVEIENSRQPARTTANISTSHTSEKGPQNFLQVFRQSSDRRETVSGLSSTTIPAPYKSRCRTNPSGTRARAPTARAQENGTPPPSKKGLAGEREIQGGMIERRRQDRWIVCTDMR